ncbi:hypothetical protein M426DRAFT_135405 [Hypoxylon sp. CI-4A]|nr:hypothetical protein M426DRAFT_135405 [Hypoxylon sp. CI-4A]
MAMLNDDDSQLILAPKVERAIVKDQQGRYVCEFAGCTDEIKVFLRKCEWTKHMDKHDRPYKCLEPGCEKLSGFTYSGGLTRHEKEVHGKRGGSKNKLFCPHGNCKRHEGKFFTRMENLNEHLRRCHTPPEYDLEGTSPAAANPENDEDEDDAQLLLGGGASVPATPALPMAAPGAQNMDASGLLGVVPKTGDKRKATDDLRDDAKRLQVEDTPQIQAYQRQTRAMMNKIQQISAENEKLLRDKVALLELLGKHGIPIPPESSNTTTAAITTTSTGNGAEVWQPAQ